MEGRKFVNWHEKPISVNFDENERQRIIFMDNYSGHKNL